MHEIESGSFLEGGAQVLDETERVGGGPAASAGNNDRPSQAPT